MIDYTTVTEIPGEIAPQEQIQRMFNRYWWAGNYIKNKKILEIACGAGQGLAYFSTSAQQVTAGDIDDKLVQLAQKHSGQIVNVSQLNAEALPFRSAAFDVVVFFEAIYYLKNPDAFLMECKRVLKPGGHLLIATANKDLYDFNPSPFSHQYFGVVELKALLNRHGFSAQFYGDTPLSRVSLKQKVLRPIKKAIVSLNLMPRTMRGKRLLKRLVFGRQTAMPERIPFEGGSFKSGNVLDDSMGDRLHKVILCEGRCDSE